MRRWILLGDLAWTTLAFVFASLLRYGVHWDGITYHAIYALLPFLVGSCFAWIVLFYRMRLDGFHGGWWMPSIASGLFLAVFCEMSLLLAAAYVTRQYVSRLALTYYVFLLLPGFLVIRHLARRALRGKHVVLCVCFLRCVCSHRVARSLATYRGEHHPARLLVSHSDPCLSSGCAFPSVSLSGALAMV